MTQGINLKKSGVEQVVLGMIDLPSVLLVRVTYCPRLCSAWFILLTVGAMPLAVRYEIVLVTANNPIGPRAFKTFVMNLYTGKGTVVSNIV